MARSPSLALRQYLASAAVRPTSPAWTPQSLVPGLLLLSNLFRPALFLLSWSSLSFVVVVAGAGAGSCCGLGGGGGCGGCFGGGGAGAGAGLLCDVCCALLAALL